MNDFDTITNLAMELQSIAQIGLTYTKDVYDKERFERIREISAE
ncbi:MAG: NUDIX hydrolase N-terminal domain-containing protein, partial [Clostridium sp.]|nr:NUDIX hydrolase N-terminal domain-containing protein [Clostridium sp.]